jgi:arylsulfatase A-like enzyme
MEEASVSARPDILLLVLDTQRADRLSCYGHDRPTSPQLDAFAADATLFQYAISPAQWTVPVHASLFTGLYPASHNTLQASSRLPATLPPLAERLRAGGYHTAGFCNNPLVGVVDTGMRRGFESFLNYSGLLTNRPNQAGAHPGPVGRYRQWFKRQLSNVLVRIQDSFARSDALLAFSFTPFMVPLWQTALSFKGNGAKALDDVARLHIERRGVGERPIFSFVNLMGTHAPYHPPRRFVERFAPEILRDAEAQRYLRRFNSDIYGWLAPLTGEIDEAHKAILDGIYDSEVAYQDELLGTLFARLRASGRLDNTLVLIVADHGDHHGEKRMIGHSFSLYNELIRVPLIVRDPTGALARGTTVTPFVSTRRVFHTALAAAGLASPAEGRLGLAELGARDPERGTAFSEAFPPQNVLNLLSRRQPQLVRQHRLDERRRAVCAGRHKLILTGDAQVELFDMHSDPAERLNLASALPERVEELRDQLDAMGQGARELAHVAEHASDNDDPLVRKRLHDLGYLE